MNDEDSKVQVELTTGDIEILKSYVKNIKSPDVYVEIGTKYGGSALVAREAVDKDVEVYTFDVSDDYYMLKDRKDIKFILRDSVSGADKWNKKNISVLFIDAHHNEAKNDFLAWEKHLTKDAIVLFHDYAVHSPQVVLDCDELFKDNKGYKVLFIPDSSLKRTGITSIYQVKKLGR